MTIYLQVDRSRIYGPPSGKIETVELLESYKRPLGLYVTTEYDFDKMDLVIITIPPRDDQVSADPDGHSVWIVTGSTIAKIVNLPGYPKPLPKPTRPPAYEVRDAPGMGLGVFAIRDIVVGELIFTERPLLVKPRDIMRIAARVVSDGNLDPKDLMEITMAECEKQLEIAIGHMQPEDQVAFKSLANTHRDDGNGPLLGIARTNGYEAEGLFDGPEIDQWASNTYSAVTKIGSRINHSCRPNVGYTFDHASFSLSFFARRAIEAGEQLFYAYCGDSHSVAERQIELAPYGFQCQCTSCINATPETDKLRVGYLERGTQLIKDFQAALDEGIASERTLEPILELRQAMIDEGLHTSDTYPSLLDRISEMCQKMNLDDRARQFREESKLYRDPIVGKFK